MYYGEFRFVPNSYGSVQVKAGTIPDLFFEMQRLGFHKDLQEDVSAWFQKTKENYQSECLIVRKTK